MWAIDRFSDPVSTDIVIALSLAERLHAGQATLLPGLSAAAHLIVENEGWKTFGFANAPDFARERLDRSGRWLRNLAMLAEPFHQFPEFQDAAAGLDGKPPLGRAAAYEIARVATPTNIKRWIDRARTLPIRRLKLEIQLAGAAGTIDPPTEMDATGPLACADQTTSSMSTVNAAVPAFIVAVTNELEEVYSASNVAGTRSEFIDSLVAEYRTSLAPTAMTAPEAACRSGSASSSASAGSCLRTTTQRRVPSSAKLRAEHQSVPDRMTQQEQRTSVKEIQLARWTLHRIKSLGDSPADSARNCTALQATARASELAFQQIHALLKLENEIDLRIAQLLLFIEKRGSWPERWRPPPP